jgi:hypothetical protein
MIKRTTAALILFTALVVHAEDYQYQYFNDEKNKYVPFSDYIPRSRLHYKTVPHYVEDFYELYGMKQYYNENSLRKNIDRLKIAMECKFRHPSEALVQVDTEEEYYKYRNLMFMHINMLIMRNYLKIAARYDKHRIYFYNADFADDIKKSLDIADGLYRQAVPYWNRAREHARKASSVRVTTRLAAMESERYAIIKNELDYDRIIGNHIDRLKVKKKKLDDFLSGSVPQ